MRISVHRGNNGKAILSYFEGLVLRGGTDFSLNVISVL